MAEGLVVLAATALDWALAWGLWSVIKRVLGRAVPRRLDLVMPWLLFQSFILGGLLITGALAETNSGAVLLTGIPVALLSAFVAVPLALYRGRTPGTKPDWRTCLDHSYAAAGAWSIALVLSVLL